MGLDQYAYQTDREGESPVIRCRHDREDAKEIHYWRKHPNLEGWMKGLFLCKGGELRHSDILGSVFNGCTVDLTLEDIDALESAVEKHTLPETEGFFFGVSYDDDEERKWRDADDMEFIQKARDALNAGLYVYYTSWWALVGSTILAFMI